MSANWSISRNSSDPAPVSDDLTPQAGTVKFNASQVTAVISLNIVADNQPEEAEAFVFKLLPNSVTGNVEVDEPMQVSFENLYFLFWVCVLKIKAALVREHTLELHVLHMCAFVSDLL